MSKAMQLVGIILLGIFTLVIIYLMSDVRSTNELDYYLLQEVTEASMYDAVDYSYFRESGLIKVDRDMFLESFTRRFAESVDNNREYDIKIIDFNETPPKVSIEVTAPTVASVKGEVALVTNRVSGIIETIYDDYVYSRANYGLDDYDDVEPEVEVVDNKNNTYNIKMSDNYMLLKYAIVESNTINEKVVNNIDKWIEINDFVSEYEATTDTLSANKIYWAVVMDRGGLWAAAPITDIKPWASSWNGVGTNTIGIIFKDDKKLASYKVEKATCSGTVSNNILDGTATCKGSWKVEEANPIDITDTYEDSNGYITSKVINISLSGSAYYAVTVKDNKGKSNTYYFVGYENVSNNNCEYAIGKTWTFDYTGGIQDWTAPCDGTYRLEVYGAEGGSYLTYGGSGKGGFSSGNITLSKDKKLYVVVGQKGSNATSEENKSVAAAYNGGSSGHTARSYSRTWYGSGGGGATHIATTNRGILSNYESHTSEVLIVAGGGGGTIYDSGGSGTGDGSFNVSSSNCSGGDGGGTTGENGYSEHPGGGGTQTSGGTSVNYTNGTTFNASFGQGAYLIKSSANSSQPACGGGGGYYGGGFSTHYGGCGGGSGYTTGLTDASMTNGVRSGNGYARIIYMADSSTLPTADPITLDGSNYAIKEGCSGVWKDDEKKTEGCYGDKDGQTWTHNDNTNKSFNVDTTKYSKAVIKVSNLRFQNQSKLSKAPNCASLGICRYNLIATFENSDKEVVIKSWKVEHQEKVEVDNDGGYSLLTGATNSGTITLDFKTLGVKNTGDRNLIIKVSYGGINGLSLFEGNIDSIKLEN